jgi:hypothetical protein
MKVFQALALALLTGAPATPAPRPAVSLVVFVTVDQLRPDYLTRFGSQLTGGLHAILEAGTLYDHGRQNHAITETAPGHATLLSGREPVHTGILDNEEGVGDSTAPLLGVSPEPGASPRRFKGTSLYDWLHAANPETRLLSVSRKDRGAILPVGRARAPVYWWVNGKFTTSRYYGDTLPRWVRAFNERGSAARLAGTRWSLLLPPSAYTEPDAASYENGGKDITFPHLLPGASKIAEQLQDYPWMDSLTLAFALEGARVLDLGRHRTPDLLLVSLSTTDAVGHRYGPDSREIHDQILRLDRWLGWFLDSFAKQVPRTRTLVVLTSDHGVQSYPERVRGKGRVWLGDMVGRGERFGGGLLSADTSALAAAGFRVDSVARAVAAVAARRPGIARVFTPATLEAASPADTAAILWRNAIPEGHGWLFAAVLEPGFVWSTPDPGQAQHGSTASEDVTVPMAFAGPGIGHAVLHRGVRTVDIAPTLAALLGVKPDTPLDGVPLAEIVGSR